MYVARRGCVPESHRDLLDAPFATLATVGPRGRPQMSTVCFLASEDGTVKLSVNATRQKSRNMVRNPMGSLLTSGRRRTLAQPRARGDAVVETDDDDFADQLGVKHDGLDLRDMDQSGEHRTVVTISLTRVRAFDMRVPGTVVSSLNR